MKELSYDGLMERGIFLVEVHIVQKGDTLWKISRQYGISFEELKRVNAHLANPDYIVPGMKIFLPAIQKTHTKKTSEGAGVKHEKPHKEKSNTSPVVKEQEKVKEPVKEKTKEPVKEKKKEPIKEKLPVPKEPIPLPQVPEVKVPEMPQMPQAPQPPPMQERPMWQVPPHGIPIIGIPCGWMPIYDADCHHHSHMGQMHHSMPMPPPPPKPPKMPEVDMESSIRTDHHAQQMPSWDMMESTELEVTTKPRPNENVKPTPAPIEIPEAMPDIQMPSMPIQQMPMSPMPMPMPVPMPHASQGSPCGCYFQMMPQMNHGNHCNACNQPMPYPQWTNQGAQQFPNQGQNPNWYGAY